MQESKSHVPYVPTLQDYSRVFAAYAAWATHAANREGQSKTAKKVLQAEATTWRSASELLKREQLPMEENPNAPTTP